MAFNPKTVFGLCNVLNRHSELIELILPSEESVQYHMEQWAKRMDLVYRDSKTNWEFISKNPLSVIENLASVQSLASQLIIELYQVEYGVQKQISKDLRKGGFTKFRTKIREQFDLLKAPIDGIKLSLEEGLDNIINPSSIGAIDAAIDVWKSCDRKTRLPKLIFTNNILNNFVKDCFEVFEVKEDLGLAYSNWYKLTQK
jgi:hypothetical protein